MLTTWHFKLAQFISQYIFIEAGKIEFAYCPLLSADGDPLHNTKYFVQKF